MESILLKKYAEILHDEEKQIFHLIFKDDISDTDYKDVWEILLKSALENNSRKMIIDQRNIGKVNMSARAWLLTNWIPRAKKKLGNEFTAAILSSSYVIHKAGIRYLVSGIQKLTSFNIKFVESEHEGESWLLTANKAA